MFKRPRFYPQTDGDSEVALQIGMAFNTNKWLQANAQLLRDYTVTIRFHEDDASYTVTATRMSDRPAAVVDQDTAAKNRQWCKERGIDY